MQSLYYYFIITGQYVLVWKSVIGESYDLLHKLQGHQPITNYIAFSQVSYGYQSIRKLLLGNIT